MCKCFKLNPAQGRQKHTRTCFNMAKADGATNCFLEDLQMMDGLARGTKCQLKAGWDGTSVSASRLFCDSTAAWRCRYTFRLQTQVQSKYLQSWVITCFGVFHVLPSCLTRLCSRNGSGLYSSKETMQSWNPRMV